MKINNTLLYREFVQRENDFGRAPYNPEFDFYHAIKSGDQKKVQQFCMEPLSEKKGLGLLSHNPLQNIKYHFAITVALVTRYCIEGGMDFHTAYDLSDYYILTADQCTSKEEISNLHISMCKDYTKKMQGISKQKICSKHISECVDYIHDNLHTRITLDSLADRLHLSPSYLSRLFKKETGRSVSDYIQYKKIETAKRMLIYSDYSVSEIAAILAFPSHSYFSELFRKDTKLSPLQYRATFFRKLEM